MSEGGFGGLGIGNPGSYGGQQSVGAPGFGNGYNGGNGIEGGHFNWGMTDASSFGPYDPNQLSGTGTGVTPFGDVGAGPPGTTGNPASSEENAGEGMNSYSGLQAFWSDIQKSYRQVKSMITAHPFAYALGSLASLMSPLGATPFGMLPGMLMAGVTDEFSKAKAMGWKNSIAAGMNGFQDPGAGTGDGERVDAAAVAGAQAEQATAAAAADSAAAGTEGLTPESAAADAAEAERQAARQRMGLMAMRLTDPWAMLTEAPAVFRPGVFA